MLHSLYSSASIVQFSVVLFLPDQSKGASDTTPLVDRAVKHAMNKRLATVYTSHKIALFPGAQKTIGEEHLVSTVRACVAHQVFPGNLEVFRLLVHVPYAFKNWCMHRSMACEKELCSWSISLE